ncbi:hypothetical protein DdX_15638 [Ditylenchus destructor]|uniref:Uncharacterized protein n=1 Tax=Ditylenchus destructor TaxID=166010 RepID=A0AAD4QUL0_9BILA|nr:hypothetical protein DdX_15638 [Ditylenchus destructor]
MAERLSSGFSNQQGRVRCPLWPMWAVHSAVHPSSALYVRRVGVNEYWPNQGRILSESGSMNSLGTLYRATAMASARNIQGYPGHNWAKTSFCSVAG